MPRDSSTILRRFRNYTLLALASVLAVAILVTAALTARGFRVHGLARKGAEHEVDLFDGEAVRASAHGPWMVISGELDLLCCEILGSPYSGPRWRTVTAAGELLILIVVTRCARSACHVSRD